MDLNKSRGQEVRSMHRACTGHQKHRTDNGMGIRDLEHTRWERKMPWACGMVLLQSSELCKRVGASQLPFSGRVA